MREPRRRRPAVRGAVVRDPAQRLSNADRWLDRWLPLLVARAADTPVLELGCGAGLDTATLVAASLRVVALDRSAEQIAQARRRVPQAEFHVQDLRAPFPVAAPLPAIVASLSLHYFPWQETVALVRRIRATLAPGGLLLCRLNSARDHHYGASGHPPIEPGYYLVDGEPKRFFDRAAVVALFADGWILHDLAEHTVQRYAQPKVLWEFVAENATRRDE